MIRVTALFLLLLSACAGTQSGAAFTLRAPATPDVPVALTPNKSGDHARELADSIERSIEAQEDRDRADQRVPAGPTETTRHAASDAQAGRAPIAAAP